MKVKPLKKNMECMVNADFGFIKVPTNFYLSEDVRSAVEWLKKQIKDVTKIDTDEDNCEHSYQIAEIEELIEQAFQIK